MTFVANNEGDTETGERFSLHTKRSQKGLFIFEYIARVHRARLLHLCASVFILDLLKMMEVQARRWLEQIRLALALNLCGKSRVVESVYVQIVLILQRAGLTSNKVHIGHQLNY